MPRRRGRRGYRGARPTSLSRTACAESTDPISEGLLFQEGVRTADDSYNDFFKSLLHTTTEVMPTVNVGSLSPAPGLNVDKIESNKDSSQDPVLDDCTSNFSVNVESFLPATGTELNKKNSHNNDSSPHLTDLRTLATIKKEPHDESGCENISTVSTCHTARPDDNLEGVRGSVIKNECNTNFEVVVPCMLPTAPNEMDLQSIPLNLINAKSYTKSQVQSNIPDKSASTNKTVTDEHIVRNNMKDQSPDAENNKATVNNYPEIIMIEKENSAASSDFGMDITYITQEKGQLATVITTAIKKEKELLAAVQNEKTNGMAHFSAACTSLKRNTFPGLPQSAVQTTIPSPVAPGQQANLVNCFPTTYVKQERNDSMEVEKQSLTQVTSPPSGTVLPIPNKHDNYKTSVSSYFTEPVRNLEGERRYVAPQDIAQNVIERQCGALQTVALVSTNLTMQEAVYSNERHTKIASPCFIPSASLPVLKESKQNRSDTCEKYSQPVASDSAVETTLVENAEVIGQTNQTNPVSANKEPNTYTIEESLKHLGSNWIDMTDLTTSDSDITLNGVDFSCQSVLPTIEELECYNYQDQGCHKNSDVALHMSNVIQLLSRKPVSQNYIDDIIPNVRPVLELPLGEQAKEEAQKNADTPTEIESQTDIQEIANIQIATMLNKQAAIESTSGNHPPILHTVNSDSQISNPTHVTSALYHNTTVGDSELREEINASHEFEPTVSSISSNSSLGSTLNSKHLQIETNSAKPHNSSASVATSQNEIILSANQLHYNEGIPISTSISDDNILINIERRNMDLTSQDQLHTTEPDKSTEESPRRIKTKYEMIMERKKLEESRTAKRPLETERRERDPRLNSIRQRAEASKHPIPIINPFTLECNPTKKRKPGIEKELSDSLSPPNSASDKTKKDLPSKRLPDEPPRKDKRAKLAAEPAQETVSCPDKEHGSRSSIRFPNRGLFLTENQVRPMSKKPRHPACQNSVKDRESHRNNVPFIDQLHAAADIPEVVSSQLDKAIKHPTASAKIQSGISQSNNIPDLSQNSTQLFPSLSHRDPRLHRNNPPVSNPSLVLQQSNLSISPTSTLTSVDWSSCQQTSMIAQIPMNLNQRPHGFVQSTLLVSSKQQHGAQTASQQGNIANSLSSGAQPEVMHHLPAAQSVAPALGLPPINAQIQPSQATPDTSNDRNFQFTARKDISMLPAPLSNAVGNKCLSGEQVLLIILSWCPEWLTEYTENADPPPAICKNYTKIHWIYPDFKHYFNTYLPLLLLENWQRIYYAWKHSQETNQKFFCTVKSHVIQGDGIEIECVCEGKRFTQYRCLFDGGFVVATFISREGEVKVFGHITNHVLICNNRSYRATMPTGGPVALHFTLRVIYRLAGDCMKNRVEIQAINNLKMLRMQVDALRKAETAFRPESILNPRLPLCNRVVLERVKSTCAESVNRAVQQIVESVDFGNPDPRIALIKAPFGADQLTVLTSLIEDCVKTAKSAIRILVCSRSLKDLQEIGVRLIPTSSCDISSSVRAVLLIKPGTSICPELANLTLENMIWSQLESCKVEDREERYEIAKKNVLKSCDVLLSIVTNCYEKDIGDILGEKSDTPISLCILNEAQLCNEPESMVPVLYGIKKFVFFASNANPSRLQKTKIAKSHGFATSCYLRIMKALDINSA